jgi:hypothetical protein
MEKEELPPFLRGKGGIKEGDKKVSGQRLKP